jgi:hypothetical protein
MTRKLIASALFAITTSASAAAAADCLKVDDDNSPEAIVSGRVTKQPIKLPKDSELRATKGFYLKLDPPLRADVGADCRDWNEIAIMPDDRIAKWNNRQVIIAGRLGRFGSALVHPPIFIEISTIKGRR